MAKTIKERTDNYCAIIAKKGSELFYEWKKSGISTSKIVSTASTYAFDKELKNSFNLRIKVLIFCFALEQRIDYRYKTFWQKFFRFFAYKKEKNSLALLKRVLGYNSNSLLKELIQIEMQKLAQEIAKSEQSDSENSGGLVNGLQDISFEQEIENILEEKAEKENLKDKQKLKQEETNNKEKQADNSNKSAYKPVNNTKQAEEPLKTPLNLSKDLNLNQDNKNLNTKQNNQQIAKEKSNLAKSQEPSAYIKNNSIISEAIGAELVKEEEELEPFPIFDDDNKQNSLNKKVDKNADNRAIDQLNQIDLQEDGFLKATGLEEENGMIYPVFKNEEQRGKDFVKPNKENSSQKDTPKDKSQDKQTISKENLARRELNDNLTKEEIQTIANNLKERAEQIMQEQSSSNREKIMVELKNENGSISVVISNLEASKPAEQNLKK